MTPSPARPERRPLIIEVIGSVLAWIMIIVITFITAAVMALIYVFTRGFDSHRRRSHQVAHWWGKSLIKLNPTQQVHVYGRENVPKDRPVIFMANHQSYSDIPAIYFINQDFRWLANQELFRTPPVGWCMGMAGYVPVRRGNPKAAKRTAEQVRSWLEKGVPVFVFPEGTRSRVGAFGKFLMGGFRLAVTTGTPIVPIVLVGTRQLLPRGGWIFRMGAKPQIHILPAITPESSDLKEVRFLARKVRGEMVQVYRKYLKEARRSV